MAHDREWVRNHRTSGYIAGSFTGEYEGEPREMLVIQTLKGVVLVPAGSTLPITRDDMVRQAALDLEPIIDSLLEGGFTLDDIAAAWQRAMAYKHGVAARRSTGERASE
jgi:hypothetical protein